MNRRPLAEHGVESVNTWKGIDSPDGSISMNIGQEFGIKDGFSQTASISTAPSTDFGLG